MNKKTTIHCSYTEIEALASKVFGCKDYSFVAVQEGQNSSSYEFEVGPVEDIDLKHDIASIKSIKELGNVPVYRNGLLLNLLHEAGELEAGEYVISVCW